MATDFRYASQTDLEMYYPSFSNFDAKRQIYGWETTGTSNLYLARNSGLVTILFADGEDNSIFTSKLWEEYKEKNGEESIWMQKIE